MFQLLQNEQDVDSDFQDEMGFSETEFDYEERRNTENIPCEVILKEELDSPELKSISKVLILSISIIF